MAITRGNASSLYAGTNGGTVTWASNPTAGQTVLVGVWAIPGETITSLVDNGTTPSTFTLDKTESANGMAFYIYRANNITLPAAGSYHVTITASGGSTVQAGGVAYTGVKAGAPTATNVGTSAGSTSVSTGSVTPAAAGALFFGGFGDTSGGNPSTITLTGSGFTSQFSELNGASFDCGAIADKIDAGGPTATPCTWTISSSAWSAAIAVYDAAPPPSVTTSSLPGGTTGVAYSTTLAATGGVLPLTWSINTGSLPAWASLNGSTGAITGTPTTAGTSAAFTVKATDNIGQTGTSGSLTITITSNLVVTTSGSLPSGLTGVPYSQSLAATGGFGAYSWALTTGSLPTGLSLSSGGVISGTPSVAATSTFTVTVTDAGTNTAVSGSLSITISVPFPQSDLGIKAEIQLAGTWTDISQYVDHDAADSAGHPAAATITRGRQDELSTSATPQQLTLKVWNGDGRFCSKNPNGAYYPNLTRNTPVRVSIPGVTGSGVSTFMQLASDAVGAASCPDSASLRITGQIDVRIDLTPEAYPMSYGDYGGGTTGITEGACLAAKWSDTGASASWAFLLEPNGQLSWRWFDGSSKQRLISGGQVATIPLGQRIGLRAVFVPSTGTVTFYTAPNMGGTWTVLATQTFGATSLANGSGTPVTVGGTQYWAPLVANVYEVQIYNPSATLVADPVFSSQTAGATSFSDGQSNTWTLSGIAGIATFGNALRDYRFYGQISSLPVVWDPTGNDVWATITASGILRRLQQGNQPPVYSTLRRFLQTSPAPYTPVAHWPCEETQGATQFASSLPGGSPMTIAGSPSLASDSSFPCSNAIPTLNGSVWSGVVAPYTATNQVSIRFLLTVPATTTTPNGAIILLAYITGGTAAYIEVTWNTGGSLTFTGFNAGGSAVFTVGPVAGMGSLGSSALISVEMGTIFGVVQEAIRSVAPGQVDNSFNATTAITPGRVTRVTINPAGNITDLSVGQLVIQSAVQPLETLTYPLNGWWGEPAGVRFARLCQENNIACRVDGTAGYTVPMGYQTADTLMNLLQQCEDTDRGQIYDPRDFLGLAYRTLDSLTNQAIGLTLDYNQDHMAPPLEPTDDDLYVVNDVTATNAGGLNGGGSTAQQTLNDGSIMSIGVIGDYQNSYSVSTQYDAALGDEAGWILHTGTNNDERYPAVTVDLASEQPQVQAITASVEALDIGSYVQIVNTPSFLPPGPVNLLVWGYAEYLGDFCNEIVFNTIPESPYEVGAADDAVRGHADTDGSVLNAGVTSSATSLAVSTTNAGSPLWTTNAGDFPFDIIIDGERMTVTNITGSSSPQTFTVTRSVNGVVKSHLAAAVVDLFQPAIAALTQ